MLSYLKTHKTSLLFGVLALLFYGTFAYDVVRSDFTRLFLLYAALFFISYKLIQFNKANFWLLAGIAITARCMFLFAIPNLSQDFYRFIWDGRMLAQGFNPYLSTPLSFFEAGNTTIIPQARALYEGMGTLNASHFTNYPPINQLCFVIAGLLSGKSILGAAIIFRLQIILADIGILLIGRKLLRALKLPEYNIFWFILNPYIIIEMTGNLHYESVMLFFVVLCLYLLQQKKWIWAAVALGLSVSVKLIPLLFLPLFLQYFLTGGNALRKPHFRSSFPLGIRFRESVRLLPKLIIFYVIVLGAVLLSFVPFLSGDFASNFGASIALWFQKFEFNASIYYIIRWIGYQTIGWNIIEDVGKILPLIFISILLLMTFFRKNASLIQLITAMVLSISLYFALSTTVHPWYVATPLLLCVFTRYRFPLVWSFFVILSYTAYGATGFKENLWFVALEYITVFSVAIYEIAVSPQRQRALTFLR